MVCGSCHFSQPHPTKDPLYNTSTKPLMYLCASVLLLVYAIGLWFTLRTHSKQIYHRKNKRAMREDHLKKTIYRQIVKHQRRITQDALMMNRQPSRSSVAPGLAKGASSRTRESTTESQLRFRGGGLGADNFDVSNDSLAVPAADFDDGSSMGTMESEDEGRKESSGKKNHGHGGPNWGTFKSCAVLLISTVLFSAIAEVLISCVDEILEQLPRVDEKFLGLTLFALIPSVTEFCMLSIS